MANLRSLKRERGFTIVEVVLVLAIAGLIFLIVFLAVPTLQRSRRDTQRRSDAARVGALLENFASNSGTGEYPIDGANLHSPANLNFTANNLNDPSTGTLYAKKTTTDEAASTLPSEYYYDQGGSCGANGNITEGVGTRKYAVAIGLEGGGASCVDSNN